MASTTPRHRAVRRSAQKLEKRAPETLGQAGTHPGVTPAAISLLLVHLRRSQPDIARSA
jgi:tRNA uridine 5-carboxymethylaminomethyl modification enzyme